METPLGRPTGGTAVSIFLELELAPKKGAPGKVGGDKTPDRKEKLWSYYSEKGGGGGRGAPC